MRSLFVLFFVSLQMAVKNNDTIMMKFAMGAKPDYCQLLHQENIILLCGSRKMLDEAQRGNKKRLLLKLINDILDISILDNNFNIKRSPTDVNACCYGVVGVVEHLFNNREGTVTLAYEVKEREKLGGYLIIDKEYEQGTRVIFSVAM